METVSKCPTGTLFSQATELTSAFIDNSPRLARATREGARGKSHLHRDDKHYFSFRNRWQFWGVMHSLWFLLRIYSTTVVNLYFMCFCFLGLLGDMDMDGGDNSSSIKFPYHWWPGQGPGNCPLQGTEEILQVQISHKYKRDDLL